MPALRAAALFVLLLGLSLGPAQAQMFSYGADGEGPAQSLSFGYRMVDFTFDGGAYPGIAFDFSEPAFGAVYASSNILASVAWGSQSAGPTPAPFAEGLDFFDVTFSTFGGIPFPGLKPESRIAVLIPIVLHGNFRRAELKQDREGVPSDEFGFTSLGLGTGLAMMAELSPTSRFEARMTPIIGYATRSLGDTSGRAFVVEGDARLHLGRLAGRAGITVGYTFQLRDWNVGGSTIFEGVNRELFDYRTVDHLFSIGVNF